MEKIVGKNDLAFFKELFQTLDTDNSGSLDKKELELALKHTSQRPDKLQFYLDLTDDDNSGTINFNEFMNLIIISQCDFEDLEKSVAVFEKYDVNKNGKLDRKELRRCIGDIGIDFPDDKFKNFYDILDMDGSGYLSKVEFYMMIEGLRRELGTND